MLAFLLLAQVAAAAPASPVAEGATAGDTAYATPAVRAVVERAAARNRHVPAVLRSYRAQVESEIAIVVRLPGGFERTVQLEQVASDVRWRRPGEFEQRVVGYRSQSAALSLSSLSWLRSAWAVPHLYGNRLVLFFGRDTARARRREEAARDSADAGDRGRRVLAAVHPLADDRERTYRFSGGDTVVTIRVEGRAIPIVRVRVEPRVVPDARTLLFRGELDLDATRHELVRMRGQFLAAGGRPSLRRRLRARAVQAVLYMELVNQEVDGQYWLPAFQRIEAQGSTIFGGDTRSAARVVTRFRRILPNDTLRPGPGLQASGDSSGTAGAAASGADTLVALPHRLAIAGGDTLRRYDGWSSALGAATAEAESDDFADLAPDAWRPTGRPRLELRPERQGDVVRFNRVEGLYTGLAARLRFRDAAPGLVLSGHAGYAWSERVVRGAGAVSLDRGPRRWDTRAGRALRSTSDFLQPWDEGLRLAPLLDGRDPSDYLDRRFAAVGVTQQLRSRARLRLESGPASDRPVHRTLERAPLGGRPFDAVRHVEGGRYVRSAAVLDLDPAVGAGFVRPGAGARLLYERGDGELRWQRVEARLTARRRIGPLTLDARADAGAALLVDTLPQQLYELGGREGLTGYAAKTFGGDRVAVARATALHATPWLRAPVRVGPTRWRLYLPGASPGIAASVHAGWSGVSDGTARAALARLGMTIDPVTGRSMPDPRGRLRAPVPTGAPRTTVELTLRLFGDAVALGAARPVDHGAGWRVVLRLGEEW